MSKRILKSPVQLQQERAEDEKLANEISDALEMAERALSNSDPKAEERVNNVNDEGQKAKTEEMVVLKTPEELNKELEEAQELAKEISNALDVAERALKLNPNTELEDPMIEIGKVNRIDITEASVSQSLSSQSVPKKKISRAEKRKRRKEKRDAMNARTKTAKTQADLDAQLMEAQSLAKEIADALDVVEEALKMAPANTQSSYNELDNLSP